jgi:hypothetical protein
MPYKTSARIGSGFAQVQMQVRRLRCAWRSAAKATELGRLKNEESKLSGLAGLTATSGGSAAAGLIGSRKPRII